jgi:hypothetical protein
MTPASHLDWKQPGTRVRIPAAAPNSRISERFAPPGFESKHITYYSGSTIVENMRHKNVSEASVFAILIVGLTLYLAPSILPSVTPVEASSRTISLVGTTNGAYYYWNNTNPTITVTQGDSLTITVSSANTVAHRLLIDLDKDGYTDTTDCGTLDVCSMMVPPSYTIPSFTINPSPGTYTYYCTVHPGSMFGSLIVQSQSSTMPDFSITPSTTSVTATQGSSATATITLTSVNGFSGSVNLATSVSPTGPQPTVSPTSITLSAGGSTSSTLTISTSSSGYYSTPVSVGNYSVNVTASSGSLAHSTTIALTVSSTSSAPIGNPSLPVIPIIGGVVGAIVVVGVALFLIRRRR